MHTSIILTALFILITPLFFTHCAFNKPHVIVNQPDYAQELKYAESLMDQEKYAEAYRAYSTLLSTSYNAQKIYYSRGYAALQLQQYQRAIEDFSKTLEYDNTFLHAHLYRGIAYFHIEQYEETITELTHFLQSTPNNFVQENDGLTLSLNDPLFIHLINASPQAYRTALTFRAQAYFKINLYSQTIEDSAKILQEYPADTEVLLLRGIAYEKNGSFELAIQDLTKVIQSNSTAMDAYCSRGICFLEKQKFTKAISDFETVLNDSPHHYSTLINIGTAYCKMQRYGTGIGYFLSASRVEPDNFLAYYNAGYAYYYLDDYEALDYLNTAIQLNPAHMPSYYYRGFTLREQKRFADALQQFNTILRINPDDKAKTYYYIALCYNDLNETQNAIKALQNAQEHLTQDSISDDNLSHSIQLLSKKLLISNTLE